ncbi:hypothetical protein [Streptomyces sp. NPDC059378]|uniref:hypothetical protein n=1 Tax=Streptomyces sp. NPDC059378 TaxID=3346815 RepID=UPI0036C7C5CE
MSTQSEQPVQTTPVIGGGWTMKLRHEGDNETYRTIAEVWAFGAKLSETTLDQGGEVTVTDPSVHSA